MHSQLEESHLLTRFCAGFRPRREKLVGIEYELLAVDRETGQAIPYDSPEGGIAEVLRRLVARHGWRQVGEGPLLELARHGSRITLEPGAQIELSGRPHARLSDAEDELGGYVAELEDAAAPLGIAWLALGLQPVTTPDEITIIPKPRYRIMTDYLPTRGALAVWMMRVTAGAQVNLDVESAEDAAAMLRLALMIGPVATALFANSSVVGGARAEYQSQRARIWQEVDPDRCGIPRPAVEPGADIADYASWVMDAPMFFVEREHALVDMAGVSFRRFLERGARGVTPRIEDWDTHLSTVFPESRLKSYLEFRCIDGNRLDLVMGFAALVAGLVYGGPEVHARVEELLGGMSYEERVAFLHDCARDGLHARAQGGATARELGGQLLDAARQGLGRVDESDLGYLEPVDEIVRTGRTPADALAEAWSGDWASSRNAVLRHAAPRDTR